MLYYSFSQTDHSVLVQKSSKTKKARYVVFSTNNPDLVCVNTTGKFDINQAILLWFFEDDGSYLSFQDTHPKMSSDIIKAIQIGYSPTVLLKHGCLSEQGFELLSKVIIDQQAFDNGLELSDGFDYRAAMFAAVSNRTIDLKTGEVLQFTPVKQ
jgi:hypothetical protein